MPNQEQKILDILLEQGHINEEKKQELLEESQKTGKDIEKLALEKGWIDEEKAARAKADVFNLPYISLFDQELDHSVLGIIPKNISQNYQMIAFDKKGDIVKVALVNPSDFQAMEAMDFLAEENNLKIEYYITSYSSFQAAFRQYENIGKEVEKVLGAAKERFAPTEEIKELEEVPEEMEMEEVIKRAPVSQIVSVIIKHAVDADASDIHIEPGRKETRVRYRIDGILHTTLKLPAYIHSAIISRVKVLANLRLDETRVPQDGRIRLRVKDQDIDFRVSTIPLVGGSEKVVMRILETKEKAAALSDLGFHSWVIKVIERNIKKPNGMFLITGPTGSGKSTTLYTILNMLNSEGVNISTLEDPVEYYIKGVNQSQVNPEVDFTFATGLRSLLRQDPNIIMVGEIRDSETGELAIHAGLTGHLIFSTIHTRDSFGVVPRLIDMKLEPFLIASTLNAVVAQRLVRKICEHCKKEDDSVPDDLREKFKEQLRKIPSEYLPKGINLDEELVFHKGAGCSRCNDTGYQGRSVIGEILEITRQMQQIIVNGSKDADIRKEAERQGLVPMKTDALIKALEGVTSVDEVLRVTQE